jgi:hypothetical protein
MVGSFVVRARTPRGRCGAGPERWHAILVTHGESENHATQQFPDGLCRKMLLVRAIESRRSAMTAARSEFRKLPMTDRLYKGRKELQDGGNATLPTISGDCSPDAGQVWKFRLSQPAA